MTTATFMVATHEAPNIVCPDWCVIPAAEHVADLPNWEGYVIHWSSDRTVAPGLSARLASNTTPAGSPDPTEPLSVHLYGDAMDPMSPETARAAGEALIALATEALR